MSRDKRNRNEFQGQKEQEPDTSPAESVEVAELDLPEQGTEEAQLAAEVTELVTVAEVLPPVASVEEQPKPTLPPIIQKATTDMEKLKLELEIYQDKIVDKKLNQQEVSKLQYGFYNLLRGALNTENQEEARLKWNAILSAAHKGKEVAFNENYMFRGADAWPGSQVEHTNFRRLCWLIIRTADHTTRKAIAQTEFNFELIIAGMPTNAATNLINFYS